MDERARRTLALCCAAMIARDKGSDTEMLLGLADEFLQYIDQDDYTALPRPDKTPEKKA